MPVESPVPEFEELVERATELAVRVGVAIAVVVVFAVVARATLPLVRLLLDRRRRPSYTRVFSGLYRVVVGGAPLVEGSVQVG